uniref:Uncharacterized protein n=1 Tax=Hyaloperonospora arabidopsidis (strain Emoy2) TaxID=559515 RepID=M4BNK1_HYAAE
MTFLQLTCGVEADKLPICFAFKNSNQFVALETGENSQLHLWSRTGVDSRILWRSHGPDLSRKPSFVDGH